MGFFSISARRHPGLGEAPRLPSPRQTGTARARDWLPDWGWGWEAVSAMVTAVPVGPSEPASARSKEAQLAVRLEAGRLCTEQDRRSSVPPGPEYRPR